MAFLTEHSVKILKGSIEYPFGEVEGTIIYINDLLLDKSVLSDCQLYDIIGSCIQCFRKHGIPKESQFLRYYERACYNPLDVIPEEISIPECYPQNGNGVSINEIIDRISAEMSYQKEKWNYTTSPNQEKLLLRTYCHNAMMNWTHARPGDYDPSIWNLFIVCALATRFLEN